jgi:hypothetical protein
VLATFHRAAATLDRLTGRGFPAEPVAGGSR